MRAPQFCCHRSLALVPWVPEIFFLTCEEELRRPQADTSSTEDTSGEAGHFFKTVLGVQMVGSGRKIRARVKN